MKKFTNNKKIILLVVALLIVGTASALTYKHFNKKQNTANSPDNGINYNPPTEEEKQSAEDNKAKVDQRSELDKNTSPSAQKKNVSVVITSANPSSINSYISGVFEDNGTCTATFSQGSKQFTKTSNGFKDATHTSCMPIFLTRSDFPASGTWTVKVNYNSSSSEGQSQSVNIEVQ